MSTSRITRKFERFLFNGIPEHPEQTWERDANTIVTVRFTGKSNSGSNITSLNNELKNIGTFTYDFENQTESYKPIEK